MKTKHQLCRERFKAYVRENRKDLNLQYMYDSDGNYHYDGYIHAETEKCFRMWDAAEQAVNLQQHNCKGIPRKGCSYLATCGSVCNKCGNIHHAHEL